ncbi:hypothetical protein Tsubulata_011922 [Turnera subulata]|uniref:Endonuclease/exonuclease/phosphatase domain-containing protein n=1 Tax=Turnera subulata TaxID=218843 RepID=A0A9Q0F361_9ROSI|nr:hypothetical protein Tsubulata_011922 [Turnera subulata]
MNAPVRRRNPKKTTVDGPQKANPHVASSGSRFEILRTELDTVVPDTTVDLAGINPWIRQAEMQARKPKAPRQPTKHSGSSQATTTAPFETTHILTTVKVRAALSNGSLEPGDKNAITSFPHIQDQKHDPPDLNPIDMDEDSNIASGSPQFHGFPVGKVTVQLPRHQSSSSPEEIPPQDSGVTDIEEEVSSAGHVDVDMGYLLPLPPPTVYGSPNDTLRRALWQNLEVLAPLIYNPWILAGDFNALLSAQEREGGRCVTAAKLKDFQTCIDNTHLIDLGFAGPVFTWHRGSLKQRLDRALCNEAWLERFEETIVYHLPFLGSDHRPPLISLNTLCTPARKESRFHFQTAWLSHESFPNFVRHAWKEGTDWCATLQQFSQNLQEWNSTDFGNIFRRKRRLLARITGIQRYLDKKPSRFLANLDLELRWELDSVLAQEEMY